MSMTTMPPPTKQPARSASHRVAPGTARLVKRILAQADSLKQLPLDELRQLAVQLRRQVRAATKPENMTVPAFSLATAVIHRIRQIDLHPCQVSGGLILTRGRVAEMATGEGKTFTSVLPTTLWAMLGRGVHVITTNDYLAERDAQELRCIYEALGLSVGFIVQSLEPEARRQAYARDVTYGTASEIGFDFLRDRMAEGPQQGAEHRHWKPTHADQLVQRPLFAAIIDEADSVLIDDASTPLIIGVEARQQPSSVSMYRWARTAVERLQPDVDYLLFPKQRQVMLTDRGARSILLGGKPRFGAGLANETLLEHCEKMLTAHFFFRRGKQYTIDDGEIALIDESTNRTLPGRKLQRGLHHCIEAKEGLVISAGTDTGSKISVQRLFRRYRHLAGMTGTGWNVRKELRNVYGLSVTCVPTNKPCLRNAWSTRVFRTQYAKYAEIVEQVLRLQEAGRAVLIGTPNVSASQRLSLTFEEHGIEHQTLNALHEEMEATIIADAGEPGRVTIATNMAGRGTDIKLHPTVREAGGLHVIVTELNSSARVDRQLVGRAARQGDPGSYQYLLSLEDELIAGDKERAETDKGDQESARELPGRLIRKFRQRQEKQERYQARNRKRLLKQDKKLQESYKRAGLCPFLEAIND